MRKKRFTEHQIIKVLKQVEGGRAVSEEVCREYGVSQGTYYNWKAKYGGMEASDGCLRRGSYIGIINQRYLRRNF